MSPGKNEQIPLPTPTKGIVPTTTEHVEPHVQPPAATPTKPPVITVTPIPEVDRRIAEQSADDIKDRHDTGGP